MSSSPNDDRPGPESDQRGDNAPPSATPLPVSQFALEQARRGSETGTGDAAPEDATDLAAALAGDHEAFGRIYDRHAAVVLSLCRRHAGPGADGFTEADDAVQETFIRAHRLLANLESPGRLRSWLFGIARRVCSERRRAAGRRRRHEGEAMNQSAARLRAGDHPAPAEQSEQLDRLGAALESLPEDERLAVHLYYLDQDPISAAQDALGLSRSGFYKLLARAREHLAAGLKEARLS
ncbi:MAG: sigma-70 family RNA polymerase sigma factor [Phycisphaerales bacterium]|nr:sigma-70 family RNA polymerase sigma factor [Phycisphaerales bacterium]